MELQDLFGDKPLHEWTDEEITAKIAELKDEDLDKFKASTTKAIRAPKARASTKVQADREAEMDKLLGER